MFHASCARLLLSAALSLLAACGHSPRPSATAPAMQSAVSALALAPGQLDPTFGVDGQISPGGTPRAVAALPDGALLVVGSDAGDFALTRIAPDGAVQRRRIDLGGRDEARGIFLQDNGKILITGTSQASFALVRLHRDLRPDPSLGKNGTLVTQLSRTFSVRAVDVGKNGKVVVGGSLSTDGGSSRDYAVARFLPNGRLDPGFGSRGITVTPVEPIPEGVEPGWTTYGEITALAVQADGSVVAGAEWIMTGLYSPSARLARYRADGSLDTSYGQRGWVDLWGAGRFYAQVTDLALQPDGQVVAVGGAWSPHCYVGRVSRDGQRVQRVDLASWGLVNWDATPVSVALQREGKLLVAGCRAGSATEYTGALPPTVARLNADLTLDTSFGQAGHRHVADDHEVLVTLEGKVVVGLDPLTRLLP